MKESKLPTYYNREKFNKIRVFIWASQVTLVVKNSPDNAGNVRDMGQILGSGRHPGEGNGTHSRILAWRNPWTKETDVLHSTGLQRFGNN